jgi:hypothetical protein
VKQLQEAHTVAKNHIIEAQERMKTAANQNYCKVDFDEEDKVWLSLKPWTTECPSKKLDDQCSGPYKILEKRGHSFKLQLPDSTQIHPVHPPERLRKAADDPLPGQHNELSKPIIINEEEEWEVEEFLASKIHYKKVYYWVKWIDQPPDHTFYRAGNFKYLPHLMKQFHEKNPTRAGPP